MKKRLLVVLKINNKYYKFLSISDNAIITDYKVNFNGDGNHLTT